MFTKLLTNEPWPLESLLDSRQRSLKYFFRRMEIIIVLWWAISDIGGGGRVEIRLPDVVGEVK